MMEIMEPDTFISDPEKEADEPKRSNADMMAFLSLRTQCSRTCVGI